MIIIPEVLEPMKAQANDKYIEAAFKDPMYIAQRKLDGWRYRLQKDHEGVVKVISYGTAVVKKVDTGIPIDKTAHVPHLVKWAEEVLPISTLLDGEIITHLNCESHDVTRIMGSDAPKAVARQEAEGWVTFAIIDIPFLAGRDLRENHWITRQTVIEKLVKRWDNPKITSLDWVECGPDESSREWYEEIVESGGEGVILKHRESTFEFGSRPKVWQKVKKYKTFDVVVVGYEPPEKEYKGKYIENWPYWVNKDNCAFLPTQSLMSVEVEGLKSQGYIPVTKRHYNGWPGSIRYGQYVKTHEAAGIPVYELKELGTFSGMNEEHLELFGKYPEDYMNAVIEVGAMRQDKRSGALVLPRFKRLREDKKPEQCILGEC